MLFSSCEVERVVIDIIMYLYKQRNICEVVEEFNETSVFMIHVVTDIVDVFLC